MAFDIIGYKDKFKDFYGDAPLEDVAKDVFERGGYKDSHPDFDTWSKSAGIDSMISEDKTRRNPVTPTFMERLTGATAHVDPSRDDGTTLGAFAKTLSRVPENLVASGIAATQGVSGASVTDKGVGDRIISWVDARNKELANEYAKSGDFIPGLISKGDVAQLGPNLAFSGISMGASVLGGVAGALTPVPGGALAGTMAAGGLAAHRMQSYQAMSDWLDRKNQESVRKYGRPINAEEEKAFKQSFESLATESGLWEAGPEAVGNALELALLTAKKGLPIGKFVPDTILKKIASGAGRMAGVVGTELGTETVTQMGQQNVDVKAGQSDAPLRDFSSPEDWLKSAGEVLPQVLLLSGVMGAGGAAYRRLNSEKKDKPPKPELSNDQLRALSLIDTLDTGVRTGKVGDEEFTPDHAIEVLRLGRKENLYTHEDLDIFKRQYPGLRDRINDLITEDVQSAVDLELTKPTESSVIQEPVTAPAESITASVESSPIDDHVKEALQTPTPIPTAEAVQTKVQTKETLTEKLVSGEIVHNSPVRLTSVDELRSIIDKGQLSIGEDAEGVPGISAQRISKDVPIVAYGPNDKISAAIVFPDSAIESDGNGVNEVKIRPDTKIEDLRFVIDGQKDLLTFDALKKIYEGGDSNVKVQTEATVKGSEVDVAANEAATPPISGPVTDQYADLSEDHHMNLALMIHDKTHALNLDDPDREFEKAIFDNHSEKIDTPIYRALGVRELNKLMSGKPVNVITSFAKSEVAAKKFATGKGRQIITVLGAPRIFDYEKYVDNQADVLQQKDPEAHKNNDGEFIRQTAHEEQEVFMPPNVSYELVDKDKLIFKVKDPNVSMESAPAPVSTSSTGHTRIPKELSRAKPRYNYGEKSFTLKFSSDVDMASYIAQQGKSKRSSEYMDFVKRATGMTESAIKAHGAKVKDAIKSLAKTGNHGDELVIPERYSGPQYAVKRVPKYVKDFFKSGHKYTESKSIIAYHGTSIKNNFDRFDDQFLGSNTGPGNAGEGNGGYEGGTDDTVGHWFTPNKFYAEMYARNSEEWGKPRRDQGQIYKVNLDSTNLYQLEFNAEDKDGNPYFEEQQFDEEFVNLLDYVKNQGYDGVIFDDYSYNMDGDSGPAILIFNTEKAKIIGKRPTTRAMNSPQYQKSSQALSNDKPSSPMATLKDVQDVFKGQEVVQPGGLNSTIYVKTSGGQYMSVENVNYINPDKVEFKTQHGEEFDPEKHTLTGAYLDGNVQLVRNKAGKWTLAHESMHFIEDVGILNANEVGLLERHITNLIRDKKNTWERNDNRKVGGSEDRADFLADAMTQTPTPTGLLGRIIAKVQDFIDKIVNAFGKRTVQGVVRDVTSGKVYERPGYAASEGSPMYAIQQRLKPFFSKLDQVVGQKMGGKMPIDQLVKMLKSNGVTDDEVDNLIGGLRDKGGTVTKRQVLDEIVANTTEFKDVILGEHADGDFPELSDEAIAQTYKDQYLENENDPEDFVPFDELTDEEKSNFRVAYRDNVGSPGQTKFSQYVEPGAVEGSYREMFVTAPSRDILTTAERNEHAALKQKFDTRQQDPTKTRLTSAEANRLYELSEKISSSYWSDGHSAYSDVQNPIVRIRFDERSIDGKRILFVEEMQGPSDENQKKMPDYLRKRIYDIGVKRVLAYAKDNGFDGVAWTTGQMQADRYDLSKQIDSIDWNPSKLRHGDDTSILAVHIIPKSAEAITLDVREGIVIAVDNIGNELVGKSVADVVGKDIAQKISEGPEGELKGLELSIGGEGLKTLYDRTLPAMFKKYGKESVSEVDIFGNRSQIYDFEDLPIEVKNLIETYDDPENIPDNKLEALGFTRFADAEDEIRYERLTPEYELRSVSFVPITDKTPSSYPQYAVNKSKRDELVKAITQDILSDKYEEYNLESGFCSYGPGVLLPDGSSIQVPEHPEFETIVMDNYPEFITNEGGFDGKGVFYDMGAIRTNTNHHIPEEPDSSAVEIMFGVIPTEAQYKSIESEYSGNQDVLYDITDHISGKIIASGSTNSIDELKQAVYTANQPKQYNSPLQRFRGPQYAVQRTTNLGNGWTVDEPSSLDKFLRVFTDKFIDLKRVVAAITANRQVLSDAADPSLQQTLYSAKLKSEIDDFLRTELHPLVREISRRGGTLEGLHEYVHNRHAEEANAYIASINPKMPDGGSGIKTADAKAYLAKLTPKQLALYDPLAKMYDKIARQNAQLLVTNGLESQATIDDWFKTYNYYAPLYRADMERDGGMGTGQGFTVVGPSNKSRRGSEREVSNIIASIAEQRERYLTRVYKNRIDQALVGLCETYPNPDFWKLATPDIVDRVSAEKGATPGTMVKVVDPNYKYRDNVVMSRSIDPKTGKVVQRGVEFVQSSERARETVKALKNLDMDRLGIVLSASAKVTRFIASMNTQYNVVFGAVNFARDYQAAMFNLSTTDIKGKQREVSALILPALKLAYQASRAKSKDAPMPVNDPLFPVWESFQQHGGMVGYRDLFRTREDRLAQLQDELKRDTGNVPRQVWYAFKTWLSDYNTAIESGVRLAAYKVGLDNGMTMDRAAAMAKNLTIDFNKKGQIATQAGAMYAFFNASVQGAVRTFETLAGPVGRKIIVGGILLGAVQAMVLAAGGFDDEEPPEFVKERNLVIPIGGKKYLTMPMPLGLHILPNIGRITSEMFLGNDVNGLKKFTDLLGVIIESVNPMGSSGINLQTISPTALDPLVALAENKDWTNSKIYKENDSQLNPTPGFTRTKDTASGFSKGLSWALNRMSGGTEYKPGLFTPTPDQIDYLMGQAGGGVARETIKAAQMVGSVGSEEELPAHKIPLVGRFYGESEGQSQVSSRFYETIKKMNAHELEIKGRRKDQGDVASYLKENPEARLVIIANRMEKTVSDLRDRKKQMKRRGFDEKEIKKVTDRITEVMTHFNDMVKGVK
jgi:hypothetical protein